jgi:hypothetical protein
VSSFGAHQMFSARFYEGQESVLPRVAKVLGVFREHVFGGGHGDGEAPIKPPYRQQSMRLSQRYKVVYYVKWGIRYGVLKACAPRVEGRRPCPLMGKRMTWKCICRKAYLDQP